jgi:hypothetical protein
VNLRFQATTDMRCLSAGLLFHEGFFFLFLFSLQFSLLSLYLCAVYQLGLSQFILLSRLNLPLNQWGDLLGKWLGLKEVFFLFLFRLSLD